MENYEVPVLVLSTNTLRNYTDEEEWAWIENNPQCIPEILDDAAYSLSTFLEDTAGIDDAIENAIIYARSRY